MNVVDRRDRYPRGNTGDDQPASTPPQVNHRQEDLLVVAMLARGAVASRRRTVASCSDHHSGYTIRSLGRRPVGGSIRSFNKTRYSALLRHCLDFNGGRKTTVEHSAALKEGVGSVLTCLQRLWSLIRTHDDRE